MEGVIFVYRTAGAVCLFSKIFSTDLYGYAVTVCLFDKIFSFDVDS